MFLDAYYIAGCGEKLQVVCISFDVFNIDGGYPDVYWGLWFTLWSIQKKEQMGAVGSFAIVGSWTLFLGLGSLPSFLDLGVASIVDGSLWSCVLSGVIFTSCVCLVVDFTLLSVFLCFM